MRVQFNSIHRAFLWAEEDPWRYFYSFYRSNEQVGFVVEWLPKQCEATSWRALAPEVVAVVEVSIPVCNKGKRKIVDDMEQEQSYKFQEYPLVENSTLAIEEKRRQHDKKIT